MPAYRYKKGGKEMWYTKIYFQDSTGKNRQRTKRGFTTKKAALEYESDYKIALKLYPQNGGRSLSDILQSILSSTHTTPPISEEIASQKKFCDIYDEYLSAIYAKNLTPGTMETKIGMLKNHILPFFSNYAISDITAQTIQKWQHEMKEKSFSATYLHTIQSQLNAILNYCVRKKYILVSPMVDLKNLGNIDAPPRAFWTINEWEKFAHYAKTRPQTFLFFELCFWLGLRRGETLGIRPMDISYDSRMNGYTLHIATSVDAKHRVGKTKTASSDRILALPASLKSDIDTYISTIYNPQPTQRIFEHISTTHLYRDITWAIEMSGVPKICIHGMRHSCATHLISSGKLTSSDVARWLGHSSARTTLRTYTHILPETEIMTADLIEAMRSKI